MLDMLFPLTGGIGLFLIGMMLLSEGLVGFGGGVMQQALVRFTGTPFKAFVSGAAATVVVQSSSATSTMLIGFVSAGLITFTQAIGVLIGASLGNTATGWIVAGLGLKIKLGFYTLPMIGVGALIKLLAPSRMRPLGLALAGFGTMFLGLNTLQDGMQGLTSLVRLNELPTGGYGPALLAMLAGLALTAVLQSSTAAIAMTLAALHEQAVNFDQAAALVVGASIGTTLTSALIVIGGTLYAKRTALAYILFNLIAGLIAIALLPVLLRIIDFAQRHGLGAGALSLAAFHTLFIGLGAALFLPLIGRFARWVERLLPERDDPALPQHLDDSLLGVPAVALEASQRALERAAHALFGQYAQMLGAPQGEAPPSLARIRPMLQHAFDFITRISVPLDQAALARQRIAQLHAADHLMRLHSRLLEIEQMRVDFAQPEFQWAMRHSRAIVSLARAGIAHAGPADWLAGIGRESAALGTLASQTRHAYFDSVPAERPAALTLRTTDAFRWLERTGHNVWRTCHYLAQSRGDAALLQEPPLREAI